MEKAKKARSPLRMALTKTVKEAETEVAKKEPDRVILRLKLEKLERLMQEIRELDRVVLTGLLDADCSETDYSLESASIEEYEDKYSAAKLLLGDTLRSEGSNSGSVSLNSEKKRAFKLPKIELKTFNGDITEWLSFWSQFQKIHEDDELDPGDKFQYLVQATVVGSRARELVESYPQSEENYPKAIAALKQRFGRTELLIEVYVRELLKLTINNVSQTKEKLKLSTMYDKLESHLRALESLGVASANYAAMLFPMVESSLPEALLVAWQRDPLSRRDGSQEKPPRDKLSYLMEFLRSEVEGEERVALAKAGFGVIAQSAKTKKVAAKDANSKGEEVLPTAAGLLSMKGQSGPSAICSFCEKGHDTKDCIPATKMSLQEKRTKLIEKKCCFVCFRSNHVVRFCKAKIRCPVCGRRHHVLMCPELPAHKEKPTENTVSVAEGEQQVKQALTSGTGKGDVLLQTLKCRIVGPKKDKLVRILIDSGSQRSYILKRTAQEIGIEPLGQEVLVHSLFGGERTGQRQHDLYRVQLKHANSSFSYRVNMLDQDIICGSLPRAKPGPWLKELNEKNIWLSDISSGNPEIEVLLGADVCGSFLTGRIHQVGPHLTAMETQLGWTVMGTPPNGLTEPSFSMAVTSLLISDASLTELWKLETIGIRDPVEMKSREEEDQAARDHFLSTVEREEDGRYTVGLPWINSQKEISSNFDIAERRLYATTRKIVTAGRMSDYDAVLADWMSEGIIEEVPTEEHSNPCHYLPHRPVFKDGNASTAVRPVFDASCKSLRSPSLNECLLKGPNLLELVPSILLRFREKRIGVTADIRRAFLMINVRPEDRDFLRFLWWRNYDTNELRILRHRRVVFGVNCSPYLLGAVIEYHLDKVPPVFKETADKLQRSMYVDNCVASVDNEEELQTFMQQSKEIMSDAKLDLRRWEHSMVDQEKEDRIQISTVLGLTWNRNADTLCCGFQELELPDLLTKRNLLSAVQKIFDPLGLVSPATLGPKILLQETWAKKMPWDQELPEDIKERFGAWAKELPFLAQIHIPRRAAMGSRDFWTLHIFCDSSKYAYAAAVFLRCGEDPNVTVQLLQSKARVAPMKTTSVPRLELLACVIGSRLAASLIEAMSLNGVPVYFWSDSVTALAWIKRNDLWGTFVGNRVREICLLTNPEDWRHVPGAMNPADLPSRGCGFSHLLDSKWWEGPTWLKSPKLQWPIEICVPDEEVIAVEKRKEASSTLIARACKTPWYMIYSSRYSRIIRVVAWVLRFCHNARNKQPSLFGALQAEEMDTAERTIIRNVQKDTIPDQDSVFGLRVMKEADGLVRVQSRIAMTDDSLDFRCPILLPDKNPLVEALIREEHCKNCHAGLNFLLARLREKFWILRARRVIRSVLHRCVRCRRYTAKEIIPAQEPPLPSDRVRCTAVFEVIGVDLAGPLYLKDKTKVWIVLFTCAVYRAVHLELVSSLSAICFLQAFRRFVARRGRPKIIYSDQGTNFQGANNLMAELDWKTITSECATERIHWKFNPPSAAWWGGWWERLIRTIKGLLVRVLGRTVLNFEELSTVLCEAEAVVNGRPLTYISCNDDELRPLTPSMFLQEVQDTGVPDVDSIERTGLLKRYQYRQKLRDSLRSRFRKEYLSQLVQRSKERKQFNKLELGDVVLIQLPDKKRLLWPMAQVVKLIPGKDGVARVAELKTGTGVLTRPVQRLFPLEVSNRELLDLHLDESLIQEEPQQEKTDSDQPETFTTRTRYGREVRAPDRFQS